MWSRSLDSSMLPSTPRQPHFSTVITPGNSRTATRSKKPHLTKNENNWRLCCCKIIVVISVVIFLLIQNNPTPLSRLYDIRKWNLDNTNACWNLTRTRIISNTQVYRMLQCLRWFYPNIPIEKSLYCCIVHKGLLSNCCILPGTCRGSTCALYCRAAQGLPLLYCLIVVGQWRRACKCGTPGSIPDAPSSRVYDL